MKAILSPELLQVLQDASNKDKVRRVLTISSGAHATDSVDITVDGKTKRLTLSPVALVRSKWAAQG